MNITVASGHVLTPEASEIAYAIGREIVERRHVLITGGARGGDVSTSRGAYEYLTQVGLDTKTYIKTIVPEGIEPAFRNGDIIHYGNTRYDRRFRLVELPDLVVLIAGRKGTEDIYISAIAGGKLVLPVGKTGGVAAAKWEEFSRNFKRYYGERILLDDFKNLNPSNSQQETIATIAKWTVNLAEQLYAPKTAEVMVDTKLPSRRSTLSELIMKHFNLAELQGLCIDLHIDWEVLSGDNKIVKVASLLKYCMGHEMERELVAYIRDNRPKLEDKLPL